MTARVSESKLRAAACARRIRSASAALAFSLLALACDEPEEREPLPDWSDGYPDASAGLEQPSNAFSIALSSSMEYTARLGQRDALTRPCAIAPAEAPAVLDCLADMNELDLWVLGFAYDIHVPQGMCDFILHVPYMFANFETGQGPTRVSYTVNADGTFSDEVNAMNGKPYCQYNYSFENAQAPNCCFGSYTLAITSAATGKVTTTVGDWGGRRGDCYYGAAYVEDGAVKDPEGVPMSRFIYTHRSEHVEHIKFDGVSDKYPANVAHANYYDPADHAGGMPAALAAPGAHPYYEAYCLDDAEEIIAHLRLIVREWNQEAEFEVMGDPDSEGVEAAFEDGPIDIDDLYDWKVLTPGRDTSPNIRIVVK